jgi:hypothetical protein
MTDAHVPLPEGATEINFTMSNFDLTIDPGMDEALTGQPNKVFGRHSAWEFNAKVWFDGELFRSEVMRYQSIVGGYSARTLDELMVIHNNEYGAD